MSRIKSSDWQTASIVPIAKGSGSPTVADVQKYLDNTGSSGYFTGGTLSDGGSGTLNVAEGEGFIRESLDDNAPLLSFKWSASAGIAVPDDTTQYVYVDDAGAITLNSSEFLEAQDKILIGVVTDEGGAIESVFNLGVRLEESIGQAGRFLRRTLAISRDVRRRGLVFGETGTRNITLTAGHLWWGRTDYTITALDTSGDDRFDLYYRASPSGWTKVADQSQWPNTQYDDGTGTLNTMTNDQRWTVLWLYIEPDDHVVIVYGRDEYLTQGLADEEAPPNTLPPRLSATGYLAARLVFQRNAGTGTFNSAFDIMFVGSAVTDHGNLAGLTGDDHTNYLLIDGTRAMGGNLDMSLNEILSFKIHNVGSLPSAGNLGRMVYLTTDSHLYLDQG